MLDRTDHIHYSAALGSYLLETADPGVIQNILKESKDSQLQKLAIECSHNTEALYKICVESDSGDARLLAAGKLQDETAIRRALKKLGKRDKRVSQKLRERLEQITKKREQAAEIDNMLAALNRLGQDNQWQHDQARYDKLSQQWLNQYQSQATEQQAEQWEAFSSALKQRLAERQQEHASIQPVLDSMRSLCDVTAGFASELAERNYLRQTDAGELRSTLDSFENEWQALPAITTAATKEYGQAFHTNLQQCRNQIDTLIQNAHASQRFEALIDRAKKLLDRNIVTTKSVHQLTDDWQQQSLPKNKTLADSLKSDFAALVNRLEQKLNKQAQTREQSLAKIEQWLTSLDQALSNDQTKKASKLFRQIDQKLKQIPECPRDWQRETEKTLANYRPRLRELEGWRHWGTDRAREELIHEAQALATRQDIPVQERSKTVKDLRQRWKKLGKIDPQSGRKLWEQFDTACTEAYQPVKAHQEKEAEHRKNNLQKRIAICEKLETLNQDTDWKAPEWRDIDKQYNRLRSQWRNAGPVNRKEWEAINERFNEAMTNLDSHLENERRISLNRRQALIEKVEQLREHEDLAEAIKAAGDAQKAWQPSVTGKRHEEQKLWKRFRSALDEIYARDKDRREHDANAVKSLLEQKQSICNALEELIKLDGKELIRAHSQQQKLLQQWEDLEETRSKDGRKLEQAFQRNLKRFDKRYEEQLLLQKKNQIVHQLKGDCPAENSELSDDLNTLLLELEIILEIESPESEAEARMQLQVERLADAMSSRHEVNELDEVMSLAKRVCQHLQRNPDLENLDVRIQRICDRLVG